ncbi:hypothetical protein [Spirosoma endbachense]|uniref:Uncharacterized protein n=1 Tax=Spirosoma endbachense TaxID=2666025 RepID=A0A6P1VZT1_9BACT|nr:hypothetical protein [Spirosoma endbachense]QHV98691.1 hypothetical protein GJR95_28420 [Spirosoma endbachense]
MKSSNPFGALMHIICVIRTYCRQTADYRNPAENSSIGSYLKQHLSVRNWQFWQRLQPAEQAAIVYNQDSLPTDGRSLKLFRLRLSKYTQAGYEQFKFWRKAQEITRTQLPLPEEKSTAHDS